MVREGYLPEAVGGKRKIRCGEISLTGRLIRLRMNQIGLRYSNKEVEEVIKRIENIFLTKKTESHLKNSTHWREKCVNEGLMENLR